MSKWYVLQVLSTHEKKVKKALEENLHAHSMQEFVNEVLLPVENILEVKQGKQKSIRTPFMARLPPYSYEPD